MKIGVVAATKTDTLFGCRFFSNKGHKALGASISASPQDQTLLQVLSKDQLTKQVSDKLLYLTQKGVDAIVIYCNSLSGSIDLTYLRAQHKLAIITPLEIYAQLAKKHQIFGLLAANCQSLANIESIILKHNKKAQVIGLGILKLVDAVENKKAPEDIVNQFCLKEMCQVMEKCGAEILILGCTHFPYFAQALKNQTPLALFDPAEDILTMLEEI